MNLYLNDCPKCKEEMDIQIYCDNNCGTLSCEVCDYSYYNSNYKIIPGHNPKCDFSNNKDINEKFK